MDIELFPMPKPMVIHDEAGEQIAPKFDIKKFYCEVITMDEDEVGVMGIDGA